MKKELNNYFENIWYINTDLHKLCKNKYIRKNKEIWEYLTKDLKVLEIWVWNWDFACFCEKKWIKDYTWIDIDDYYFNELRKKFVKYSFIKANFQDYLVDKEEFYDIVYISNVFEHLNEIERKSMIKLVYSSLKKWWKWINYMPNADSVILLGHTAFWDVTHYRVYNTTSFEQIIKMNWINFYKITHKTLCIWCDNMIKKIIHWIFIFLSKVYYLWMWTSAFPKIYTWEFISILEK